MVFIDVTGPAPKTLSDVLSMAFSMAISFGATLHILGLDPFSGSFSVTMFLSKSISVHWILFASPDLIAVSEEKDEVVVGVIV